MKGEDPKDVDSLRYISLVSDVTILVPPTSIEDSLPLTPFLLPTLSEEYSPVAIFFRHIHLPQVEVREI